MRRLALLLALAPLLVPASPAGEIYKWVDPQGKVHYGDRAPAAGAHKLDVPVTRDDAADASAAESRREKRDRLLRAFEKERRARDAQRAEEKRQRAEERRRCRTAQDNLQRVREAAYLYKRDEKGERVIYSDEQRREATKKWERAVEQWC